jgi:large subunit ribosomal protein L37Ae
MVRKRRKNLVGGMGVRYGRRVRQKVSEVEADLRRKHYCQNCGFRGVKRVSVGVWECKKCAFTFTGAAYSPTSELGEIAKRRTRRGT